MITAQNIADVKKLAYAALAERDASIAAGEKTYRGGYGKIQIEDGQFSLCLDEVNTAKRMRKAIRDTYYLNGKIVAKAKIQEII